MTDKQLALYLEQLYNDLLSVVSNLYPLWDLIDDLNDLLNGDVDATDNTAC